jgi:hypothetical protein
MDLKFYGNLVSLKEYPDSQMYPYSVDSDDLIL